MQHVISDTLMTEYTHGTYPPPPQVPPGDTGDTNPNLQRGNPALLGQQARRTRHRFVRHHWRTAKQLSHTITENEIAAWLISNTSLYTSPNRVSRIMHFIELRRIMSARHNHLAALRLSAAIWREVKSIKTTKMDKKNSQIVEVIRPSFGGGKNSNVPGRIFKVESPAGGPTCSC
ncbi:MAG: hypothetical protein AB3N28_11375 [Kordiimonas sp.]